MRRHTNLRITIIGSLILLVSFMIVSGVAFIKLISDMADSVIGLVVSIFMIGGIARLSQKLA